MKTKASLGQRLEEVEDQFVDLWRTMSSLWGISPTMAQIHGLLPGPSGVEAGVAAQA